MSEQAKALGKGQIFDFKGVRYTLTPFNNDMMAMFSTWLEDQAWRRVERTRDKVPADAYAERHAAVSKLVAENAFAFGGEIAARASQTLDGQKYILFLMLCPENKDASERLASDMMDQVYAEVSARMTEANADPNSPTPTTASASPSA